MADAEETPAEAPAEGEQPAEDAAAPAEEGGEKPAEENANEGGAHRCPTSGAADRFSCRSEGVFAWGLLRRNPQT